MIRLIYFVCNELNFQEVPESSPEELQQQSTALEAENVQLQAELEQANKENVAAEELGGELDKVDTKIDELTSSSEYKVGSK